MHKRHGNNGTLCGAQVQTLAACDGVSCDALRAVRRRDECLSYPLSPNDFQQGQLQGLHGEELIWNTSCVPLYPPSHRAAEFEHALRSSPQVGGKIAPCLRGTDLSRGRIESIAKHFSSLGLPNEEVCKHHRVSLHLQLDTRLNSRISIRITHTLSEWRPRR